MLHKILIISYLAITLLCLQACSPRIRPSRYPSPTIPQATTPRTPTQVRFSLFVTGFAHTQEAFTVRGGNLFKKKRVVHTAIWVQHPNGNFLFDTGLGDSIDTQFRAMRGIERQLFKYTRLASVHQQLQKQGITPDTIQHIILSHLHWDHASGIKDFPNATTHTTREEHEFARSVQAKAPAFFPSQYDGDAVRWQYLHFEPRPYRSFAEHCDYFGDGSVIFVKLNGHTTGSIGMFVTLDNGQCYFFTGDATWSVKGFQHPAHKHRLSSNYVDWSRPQLTQTLVQVYRLWLADPALIIVPAHDWDTQKNLRQFPAFNQ